MKGDEEFLAQKQVEFGGGKFFLPGEIDPVGHHEEVIFVVFNFWQTARSDAVLNGERVEMKQVFENRFDFLVGRIFKVDPKEQAFVALDEAEGFQFQIATNSLAFAEDEGGDHGRCVGCGLRNQARQARLPGRAYLVSGPRILFSSSLTVAMNASGVAAANRASRCGASLIRRQREPTSIK